MVESDGLVELPEGLTDLAGRDQRRFSAVQRGVVMKLLYFAWLKTKTGVAEEEVSPPPEVANGPRAARLDAGRAAPDTPKPSRIFQIDQAWRLTRSTPDHDDPVAPGDEVALFPPVTGG